MNKPIIFNFGNRYYNLDFKFPSINIMQLTGDSSTGKSLLCSDFRNAQGINPELCNSLVLNDSMHVDAKRLLAGTPYDIVIIDDAAQIITPEIDSMIEQAVMHGEKTRWVIIGRKIYGCVYSCLCRGWLKQIRNNSRTDIMVEYTPTIGGGAKLQTY